MEREAKQNHFLIMDKSEKKKCGRKRLYGEPTITFTIAIPKSKKQEVKTFVESLLKSYRKP